MRVVLVAVVALACARQHPAPPPAAHAAAAPAAAPAAEAVPVNALSGTVTERIDAAQYTYLKLQTASGEQWAAVPTTDTRVGAQVSIANAAWMENFKSATLNRTWPRIAFGTLGEAPAAGPGMFAAQARADGSAALPPGHPAPGAGQPATDGEAVPPRGHPALSAAADLGAIKVAKAPGAQGRTVADVWARRAALKDQQVSVRGKVVKATSGVLGKNWLHVRDGSGQGPTGDLTVATADSAAVGDTVLITGVVHVDKDLGSGYRYDVIVEDARVTAQQ